MPVKLHWHAATWRPPFSNSDLCGPLIYYVRQYCVLLSTMFRDAVAWPCNGTTQRAFRAFEPVAASQKSRVFSGNGYGNFLRTSVPDGLKKQAPSKLVITISKHFSSAVARNIFVALVAVLVSCVSRGSSADIVPGTENSSTGGATVVSEKTPDPRAPLTVLGSTIDPGTSAQLFWSASQNYSGMEIATPVLVAHGAKSGDVLCLTAAIHGDEINGVEIVRRVFHKIDPKKLRGSLIGVPIVNLHGFERSYRYLTDRRDLNRYFPGHPTGSSASRIAHSFFTQVIKHCDALVDLHTGSFRRTNLPQLRADLGNADVAKLTGGFGATAVLHDVGGEGTLRRAATEAGIPAVTIEAGEPMRLQSRDVAHGVKAIESLMASLGMVKKKWRWREPQPVYYESIWVRAGHGGILLAAIKLGEEVEAGQLLGTVTDPITNGRIRLVAPIGGRVLGMALNQMVMPGFAVFRIGIPRAEEDLVQEAESPVEKTGNTDPSPGPEADSNEDEDVPAGMEASEGDHADE